MVSVGAAEAIPKMTAAAVINFMLSEKRKCSNINESSSWKEKMVYKDSTSLTLIERKLLVMKNARRRTDSYNTWALLIYEQTHLLLTHGHDDQC
jgi:hypothetical protein